MNRIVTRLIMLGMVLVLSACAEGTKVLPDGRLLAMNTVGDSLDRSASYTSIYNRVGTNPDGSPLYAEAVPGDLTVGPTVAGQAIAAAVPSMGTAAVNGISANAVARTNQCKSEAGCNNGGNINLQVQGAQALAGSQSDSNANVNVTETTTTTGNRCATCEAF